MPVIYHSLSVEDIIFAACPAYLLDVAVVAQDVPKEPVVKLLPAATQNDISSPLVASLSIEVAVFVGNFSIFLSQVLALDIVYCFVIVLVPAAFNLNSTV